MFLSAIFLLANAAFGQQIDKRVDSVTEAADGFSCRSHALPELRIAHDWRDGQRSAGWDIAARDTGAGDLRLRVSFRPDTDAAFGTSASVRGFQLELDRISLRTDAKGALLRIDGAPDSTVLMVAGNRKSLTVGVIERQREELAQRLMTAAIVELDLVDASGIPLARYGWDVRGLRRAPPQLQAINWSCR